MLKIKDGFTLQQTGNTYLITSSLPDSAKSPKIFAINESGALLWKELLKGTNKQNLLNILQNEYETENIEVMNDIEEFLNSLRSMEVLEGE